MPNQNNAQLSDYIAGLVQGTRANQFEWTRANPTTYTWENDGARISIQRVDRRPTTFGQSSRLFVLQAFDLKHNPPKQMLILSGGEDESLNMRLEQLYAVIGENMTQRGLDFLKSVLGQKPQQ
jgi:hypothetical protein